MPESSTNRARIDHLARLGFILAPMLATIILQRVYLHAVDPNADLFLLGYNVHHLFTGVLIEIPAAFVIAFRPHRMLTRRLAEMALGVGSAMVLDEVIYLIATDGSNAAYLTAVSLWGAVVLISAAALLLILLCQAAGRCSLRE